jgi:hypothetical protein
MRIEPTTRQASAQDATQLQASFAQQMQSQRPKGYFADCCRQQEEGQIVLLFAEGDGNYLDNVIFDGLLARDRQIPPSRGCMTLARGICRSSSSEHDVVKLLTTHMSNQDNRLRSMMT